MSETPDFFPSPRADGINPNEGLPDHAADGISDEQAVLDAARKIVDGAAPDAEKDAPADAPLPERSFGNPEEAVAEATDAAMHDALPSVMREIAAENIERLEPEATRLTNKVRNAGLQSPPASLKKDLDNATGGGPRGFLAKGGLAGGFHARPVVTPADAEQPQKTDEAE